MPQDNFKHPDSKNTNFNTAFNERPDEKEKLLDDSKSNSEKPNRVAKEDEEAVSEVEFTGKIKYFNESSLTGTIEYFNTELENTSIFFHFYQVFDKELRRKLLQDRQPAVIFKISKNREGPAADKIRPALTEKGEIVSYVRSPYDGGLPRGTIIREKDHKEYTFNIYNVIDPKLEAYLENELLISGNRHPVSFTVGTRKGRPQVYEIESTAEIPDEKLRAWGVNHDDDNEKKLTSEQEILINRKYISLEDYGKKNTQNLSRIVKLSEEKQESPKLNTTELQPLLLNDDDIQLLAEIINVESTIKFLVKKELAQSFKDDNIEAKLLKDFDRHDRLNEKISQARASGLELIDMLDITFLGKIMNKYWLICPKFKIFFGDKSKYSDYWEQIFSKLYYVRNALAHGNSRILSNENRTEAREILKELQEELNKFFQ